MMTHMSVTNYIQEINDDALKTEEYPEGSDTKTINYYLFELKEESYLKTGKEINYKRTTRVERRDGVCDLVKWLKDSGPSYLKHRSYVDNIESVLPAIRAVFTGKYIELDFSENLSMKPKVEIQSAHFSGKQFCLHCAIIEPGKTKYEYHFSDDTTHDFAFVKKVLEDIFVSREIKNEIVVIKSDNAGSQYKNKYAFESLIELSNKFNVTIVRIFGAAGHGKGLIDSMSSFGCKSILRRDIVGKDVWFSTSDEIDSYLSLRGDSRMKYTTIDPMELDSERMQRGEGFEIKGCMKKHLFVFKPNCTEVLVREYLCDCEQCLDVNFEECFKEEHQHQSDLNDLDDDDNDCHLDEDVPGSQSLLYEFVETPSTVGVLSSSISDPLSRV